jgi:DNA-binding beta-propeller fold protein YncE
MNRYVKVLYLGLIALVYSFCDTGFARADTFYVSNYGNSTIEKIDSNGNASVFASTGLNKPLGIALDKSGNLYVANSGNSTIEKFDSSGNGTLFASALGFGFGFGVAVGTNENLYVAALYFNGVAQLNSNGQPVSSSFLTVSGPTGLAFDSTGNLYVADSVHNTIVKFDPSGSSSIFTSTGVNLAGRSGVRPQRQSLRRQRRQRYD